MKNLFAFLIASVLSFGVFSQTESSFELDSLEVFFHLDSVRSTTAPGRTYEMTHPVNYFQISGGQAVLSGASRGSRYYIFGEIDGHKTLEDDAGNKIQQFYIRGRQYAGGRIRSIEIIEDVNGQTMIHYYSKFGGVDVLFKTHEGKPADLESFVN